MILLTRPASGISSSCQQVKLVGSLKRQRAAFCVESSRTSKGKGSFARLVSVSSNSESVKSLWRFQRKTIQKNGEVSMCAKPSSGDMEEPFNINASEKVSSANGTSNLREPKITATVRLQVHEERNVDDGMNSTEERLVEEYKLEETGQLSKVNVSVAGTSRSPTFVEYILIRIKPYLQLLIQFVQRFSIRKYIREYGKKKPADLNVNSAVYEPKEGVDNLVMWTSTELTLQHAQMVRIARDTRYLVWAFGLFGVVRILEAVVLTFTTRPFHLRKLLDASNALDPLTVAWLAHGMRRPMVALLKVDPSNLEEVSRLKIKFWKELHAFYERQWKVMGTLGIARLFNLIATHHPASQYFTHKLQILWNVMLSLPLF